MSLHGRGVIVTGGTGALGQAVVLRLLADGARVVSSYRDASGWQALRDVVGPEPRLAGFAVDLTDRTAVTDFTTQAAALLGGLHGLACLAGAYAGSGRLHESPAEEWDAMLRHNLESAHSVCRAALPLLERGASIVTVGALRAESGGAGAAAYAVSKAAVAALTRALAAENRDRGVRANCVLPGLIDTPANRAAMPAADRAQWTPPAAIAQVVAFLLSPASAPVSGALVPVDGRGA